MSRFSQLFNFFKTSHSYNTSNVKYYKQYTIPLIKNAILEQKHKDIILKIIPTKTYCLYNYINEIIIE
jgi:hypothetical protein